MNLVLDFKFLCIVIDYHAERVCKIELIDYLVESLISENIYTVVEHLFECARLS